MLQLFGLVFLVATLFAVVELIYGHFTRNRRKYPRKISEYTEAIDPKEFPMQFPVTCCDCDKPFDEVLSCDRTYLAYLPFEDKTLYHVTFTGSCSHCEGHKDSGGYFQLRQNVCPRGSFRDAFPAKSLVGHLSCEASVCKGISFRAKDKGFKLVDDIKYSQVWAAGPRSRLKGGVK